MSVVKLHKYVLTDIVAAAKRGQRCLCTKNVNDITNQVTSNDRECVEVQIPVPWGFLRGKWWGPTNTRPILALHGWQDNCGTYDRLAPLLPPHIGILAIDAPGHGLSSQYPPGFSYQKTHLPLLIRKFSKDFQWKHVSLLGHSIGSLQSFMYSSIFDDQVDMFIGIDMMLPLILDFKINQPEKYKKRMDHFIKVMGMDPNNPPVYSYQECLERYVAGSFQSVSKEAAPYILKRGIAATKDDPNKYYFTRDVRVKVGSVPSFSENECLNLSKSIKAPLLIIKAPNLKFQVLNEYYFGIIKKMKTSIEILEDLEIEGTHHLHLVTPENVAGPISDFVVKYDTKDRSQKPNLIDEIFIKKYV